MVGTKLDSRSSEDRMMFGGLSALYTKSAHQILLSVLRAA